MIKWFYSSEVSIGPQFESFGSEKKDKLKLISSLHGRARSLRLAASIYLVFSIGVLALGGYTFAIAGRLARYDLRSESSSEQVARLRARRDELQAQIEQVIYHALPHRDALATGLNTCFKFIPKPSDGVVSGQVLFFNPAIPTPPEISSKILFEDGKIDPSKNKFVNIEVNIPVLGGQRVIDGKYNDIVSIVNCLDKISIPISWPAYISEWRDIYKYNDEINAVSSAISSLDARLVQQNQDENGSIAINDRKIVERRELLQLIQTSVTRFGLLAIVTFLVSILTSLYRYATRLAAYYDARAYALGIILLDLNTSKFKHLSETLSPTMGFGKEPSLPLEQVSKVMASLNALREK